MSKVDAQRAMREARYARLRASGPTRREAAAARAGEASGDSSTEDAAPSTPVPAPAPAPAAVRKPGPDAGAELCGHRSMNNRTCTRPAGHAEKNHRYG